ncbi:MAG: transporter [Alphaproteobacteria bacterium]|nr:transporter [Alphaproteobacteria bacterium]
MSKLTYFAAVAAVIGLGCGQALAAETWEAKLYAADGGLATGALPGPGWYFVNLSAVATNDPNTTNWGKQTDVKSNIVVEVPELVWVTPWQVFGAKYAVGIAQAFDIIDTRVPTPNGSLALGGAGLFGTVLMPANLSWALGNNFFLDARVAVVLPTGTYRNPFVVPGGNITAVNFFTVDTALSLSWLHDGWNVSARIYYLTNTPDQIIDYRTGNVFGTEETISKKIDKWTVGVNGFTQTQVQNDSGSAVAQLYGPEAAANGHRMGAYGAGLVLGYNFGPLSITGWCDHVFYAQNYAGGDLCYARVVVPLSGESEAPKVVAAKY